MILFVFLSVEYDNIKMSVMYIARVLSFFD
jgi:hypothetical protein